MPNTSMKCPYSLSNSKQKKNERCWIVKMAKNVENAEKVEKAEKAENSGIFF